MAVFHLNFPSARLGCKADANVIMPDIKCVVGIGKKADYTSGEFYNRNVKYPVFWLLHGARGDHNEWLYNAPLERLANKHGICIVTPNGMAGDYSNYSVFADGYDFPSYMFDELMPMVHKFFPVSSKKEDNYVCGFSMGGNGSLVLSLMRPELFGTAGVFAGSIRDLDDLRPWRDMTSDTFRTEGFDTTRFHGIYPPGYTFKEVNMIAKYPTVGDYLDSPENTWDRYIEVVKRGELPRIYVTVGSDDRCTGRIAKFRELAEQLGDTTTHFTQIPGHVHSYDFAAIALVDFIEYCGF